MRVCTSRLRTLSMDVVTLNFVREKEAHEFHPGKSELLRVNCPTSRAACSADVSEGSRALFADITYLASKGGRSQLHRESATAAA